MSCGCSDEDLFRSWAARVDTLAQQHPLQIITWEATRRCNLRCQHCGSPTDSVDVTQELSADEVVNIFTQIAHDLDLSQFRHINITGGEPFARPDLLAILRRLSQTPAYRNIDIQTNGLTLAANPQMYGDLRQCGVSGIGFSIDGLEHSHDSLRALPGAWRRTIHAARAAVFDGFTVTISVVAHSGNVIEIPELFSLVKELVHPRVFRVMIIDAIGRAQTRPDLQPTDAQIAGVVRFLSNEYLSGCTQYADPSMTMVELGCGGWLGTDLEGTIRPFIFHCIAGLNNLGILYDGKLASCSNISRRYIQGDARRERVKDVWATRYQPYRSFHTKMRSTCRSCDQWEFCHGGPMHLRHVDDNKFRCLFRILHSQTDKPEEVAKLNCDDHEYTYD